MNSADKTLDTYEQDNLIKFFYQILIEDFPLESVMKNLARILYVANEKNLKKPYNIAKAIFDKEQSQNSSRLSFFLFFFKKKRSRVPAYFVNFI